MQTLLPFLIEDPADQKSRRKWLDRLYAVICEDGVDYLAPLVDEWVPSAAIRSW